MFVSLTEECPRTLLVAEYPFRGIFVDISGNHHGTARRNNGVTTFMTDDYISVMKESYLSIPNIDISTGPWTMAYHIRVSAILQRQDLLSNPHSAVEWVFVSWLDSQGK